MRDTTTAVLIVAEALHPSAPEDMPRLIAALDAELTAQWPVRPVTAILTPTAPRFTFPQ